MFPLQPAHDVADMCSTDVVIVGNRLLGRSCGIPVPHGFDIRLSQYGKGMLRTFGSGGDMVVVSVLGVLSNGRPLKIGYDVVMLVRILVIDFGLILRIRNECQSHKSCDIVRTSRNPFV